MPIEEIKADQMVWAEDPETGERALKRVVRTFLNQKDELVHVQVNGETITSTTEHPFYVQGKGWVAAKDLKVNDRLELQSSKHAFVEGVRFEKLAESVNVYNFEVEDFHTYFVGKVYVLVHNRCKLGKRLGKIEADPGSGYHAHHVFPNHLKAQFKALGIDVNMAEYGSWVEASKHLRFSAEYNRIWREFLATNPTKNAVLEKGRELALKFGFSIHF